MSKTLLREQVIKLRLQGYTYGQIKRSLGVSKSTLSDWLRNLPLTSNQQELLKKNKLRVRDLGREKFITTFKNRRLTRLKAVLGKQEKYLLPLTEKELFLAGLFLYWGEGAKRHGMISISNTDPRVVKFSLYWMIKILKIPKSLIKVNLHLYKDMNVAKSIDFWARELNLPIEQFRKPYIKKSNKEGLTYKSFGQGTCRLYAGSVELSEKIAMSIKAISGFYGAKDEIFWYN